MAESKSKLDPTRRSVVSDDLKLEKDGSVAGPSVVAARTIPNLRHETAVDDNTNFELEFAVHAPRGEAVGDEIRERNKLTVRQTALSRGLLPTGGVVLHAEQREGDYLRMVYAVPVVLNEFGVKALASATYVATPNELKG